MAVAIRIDVRGIPEVKAMLDRIDPKKNPRWVERSMDDCAMLTQKIAAEEMIIRGSRFRGPKGKRGGKGKMRNAGTHPTKLTSRHGGAGIVGSIRVNRISAFVRDIGSDKKYAAVHEYGGSFGVKSGTVRAHQRSVAFGRKVAPFTVPMHFRSGHYADYPARPYLSPGLDKASKSFGSIFARQWAKEMPK